MCHQKPAVFVFLLLLSTTVHAHAPERGRVTGTFGPTITQTFPNGEEYGARSPFQGGFGIVAEGDVDKNGGLEIGIFYQPKLFFAQKLNQSLVEKIKLINVTVGYRHWFSDEFSAGAAFLSSYTMGEAVVIHKNFASGSDLQTSARDVTEYGFVLSLQWEFWHDEERGFLIDTRYSQSVTAKEHESSNDYGLMLGFKHSIQVR